MSLEGIRDFIKNAIAQVAAMDGETNKLGDSKREVSIMNRLLVNASPEEKDFVQKYLDGEPIVNPQDKNVEAAIEYDMDGADTYTKKFLRFAEKYLVKYDEDGNAGNEDIFYDKDNNIVGKSVYSTDEDGNTVVRTEKNNGNIVQTRKLDAEGYIVDYVVEERTDEDGYKSKDVILLTLSDGSELRVEQDFDDYISVMLSNADGSGIGQAYKVEDGVVKIPQKAQKIAEEDEEISEEYINSMKELVYNLKPQFEEILMKHYNLKLEIEE